MIYELNDLRSHKLEENLVQIDGKWYPARPLDGPWIWRLRAALAVLRGTADAFSWPGNQ